MAGLRKRRRRVSPLPATNPQFLEATAECSRIAMRAIDSLPAEVRKVIHDCPFLVDINRVPRGMDWTDVVTRIRALQTFDDARDFDTWLLQAGLRHRR